MPGPFSMSGTLKMERGDERSAEKGWVAPARDRSGGESVADNGAIAGVAGGGAGNGLDSQLWHACAGAMVHLPLVGSKVIYFPQGHAEQAASPPEFPRSLGLSSTIPCRVLSVNFLADTETDEVFARIRLQPDPGATASDLTEDTPPSPTIPEKSASFAKTLTQSDANNGGGFSVPRYCAETIFPPLDYGEDPPVQIVLAKDVHGAVWKFRHIYRGTPRRHLLTTGWSNFVNHKKLVAGDAIVFLRCASGELCVGVRRSTRGVGGGDASSWHSSGVSAVAAPGHRLSRWEVKPSESSFDFLGGADGGRGLNRVIRPGADIVGTTNNFTRNRARVTANSVLEAAALAAAGKPFDVVYYPRASISEFCVKAHTVKTALQQNWVPGMRFKMAVETEDASRISWFVGTIAKVQEADPILWPNSPWKVLQVTWDEPDLLQGIVRVSPWQVELVSPMQLPPFSIPKKKVRLSQPLELQFDGQGGIMGLTMAALASNMLGHINPWHGFADSVPAGMQGARHDRSYGLAIQDLRTNKSQPGLFLDSFYQHHERPVAGGAKVSTELNMGNFAHQGRPSLQNSLSTLLSVGNSSQSEPTPSLVGGGSSSAKSTPFLLFGKAIDTTQSVRSQQSQFSGGNSSEGLCCDTLSDGNQSGVRRLFSCQGNGSKALDTPSLSLQQVESVDSSSNRVGTLSLFKEQANVLGREKATDAEDIGFTHCKVFRESDEVGRIVDLSDFSSYEELYERIAIMFAIQKSEILHRIVCMDSLGSSGPVRDEPYRDFMKRVKRLKILSESSSESVTR